MAEAKNGTISLEERKASLMEGAYWLIVGEGIYFIFPNMKLLKKQNKKNKQALMAISLVLGTMHGIVYRLKYMERN